MSSLVPEHDQWAYHKPSLVEWEPDLEALSMSIGQGRIGRIAELVRGLTYGQMMALASELDGHGPITKDTLPKVLWSWSVANVTDNARREDNPGSNHGNGQEDRSRT